MQSRSVAIAQSKDVAVAGLRDVAVVVQSRGGTVVVSGLKALQS